MAFFSKDRLEAPSYQGSLDINVQWFFFAKDQLEAPSHWPTQGSLACVFLFFFFCYGLILIPWFSRAGINGLSVSVKVWPCKRWINSHIFWTVSVSQSLAVQTLDQLTHFLLWTTDLHLEDTELGKQICTANFSVMNLWQRNSQGWRCPSEIGRKKSTKSSVMELLPLKQVKVQVQVLDLRHWHHPWRHRHRLLVQLLGLLPVDPDPSLEQLQPAEAQLVLLELRHHCQSSSQLAALQQIGS